MNADAIRRAAASEYDFYIRFCKFLSCMTLIFMVILLFLFYDDAGSKVLLGVVLVFGVIVFIFTLGSMAMKYQLSTASGIHNILTDEELRDMEYDNDDSGDDDDDDNEGSSGIESNGLGRMALYSFEDTPEYVRSCRETIRGNQRSPQDGRYKIVYNAVYFGKSIRSESRLQLKFQPSTSGKIKNNGWEVGGKCFSGGGNGRFLSDGFVNTKGEMYWRLDNPNNQDIIINSDGTYRGIFDVQTNTMFDGEFQAGSAPPGRIVRMELVNDNDNNSNATNNRTIPSFTTKNSSTTTSTTINHVLDDDGWGNEDVVEMVAMGKSFT